MPGWRRRLPRESRRRAFPFQSSQLHLEAHRLHSGQREIHVDGGSFSGLAFEFNRSTMFEDHILRHRKAETSALARLLGREERLEQALPAGGADAATVIFYHESNAAGGDLPAEDPDLSAWQYRIQGITEKG